VVGANAQDFSTQFVIGARQTLELARSKNIRVAVLKEGSPSCGSSFIFDGTFSSTKMPNAGVTAAILQQAGIHVFNEGQLLRADNMLMRLAAENPPLIQC
jgi:uncharacterized protein YbbK (DUF523 family)